MRLGIEAAFHEANSKGGINGRSVELATVDDGYEPDRAIMNTRELIEESGVFALIGAVGTPTSLSAAPIAAEFGVPYVAPFTGAEFLRNAGRLPNVVNLRASYDQELELSELPGWLRTGGGRRTNSYRTTSFGRAGLQGILSGSRCGVSTCVDGSI